MKQKYNPMKVWEELLSFITLSWHFYFLGWQLWVEHMSKATTKENSLRKQFNNLSIFQSHWGWWGIITNAQFLSSFSQWNTCSACKNGRMPMEGTFYCYGYNETTSTWLDGYQRHSFAPVSYVQERSTRKISSAELRRPIVESVASEGTGNVPLPPSWPSMLSPHHEMQCTWHRLHGGGAVGLVWKSMNWKVPGLNLTAISSAVPINKTGSPALPRVTICPNCKIGQSPQYVKHRRTWQN